MLPGSAAAGGPRRRPGVPALSRRKIGWFRVARPVIAVATIVPFFFTSLPADGNDLLLQEVEAGGGGWGGEAETAGYFLWPDAGCGPAARLAGGRWRAFPSG